MLDASRAAGNSPAIGCYTTSRVEAGRVLRVERHCARLRRDASRLGLPAPDPRAIESLLLETARSEFGRGDGIVRVEWSSSDGSDPRLVATTRPIGPEPATWRAGLCSTPHPGPEQRHNTKFIEVEVYEIARREAREQGVQEVLIFDRDGFVVEGGSSNLLVVDEGGRLMTPDPALGSVAGLGLEIVRESQPGIAQVRLRLAELHAATELLAVNAVRGAVPIVELDGQPVGDAEPGSWARRLRTLFFRF